MADRHYSYSHAATWPTSLTLTISEKHAVPMSQLQAWMKNNNPAVCTFAANPRAPNAVNNEMGYKALVALLSTKNYVSHSFHSATLP